jgi:hypothetical protein
MDQSFKSANANQQAITCRRTYSPLDAAKPYSPVNVGFLLSVLHQFHCDFSLSLGESGFSTFPVRT